MMCKASAKDRSVTLKIGKGFRQVSIKRGQFIFGRNAAEKQLELDGSMIYRILQKFEADSCISIEANNQFSIISLSNFDEYQSFEEEDFLEIDEDRTTNEQPMNNQRTTNEQQTNSTRTADEQRVNTNKKVNNSKEGEEGGESKEGKENGTPASAGVSPSPISELNFEPAQAETLTPISAPKNGRKKREDLLGRFQEIYSEWMKGCHGIPAQINGTQTNASKSLIAFFRNVVKMNASEKQITLTEQETEEKILKGWGWFLSRWLNLDPFFQDKLTLVEINSKIPNLYKQALNGTAKQQAANGNGGGAIKQAERIINRINNGNNGR